MYITNEDDLLSLCDRLKTCDMLALDTEFVRERTYFHHLGLIQVATDGVCAAIDPILLPDIGPFLDLIRNPNIQKVFHAAKQDLEILYRLTGTVIRPIFDTQVAAALVGWGAQISFAKIVHRVTGKKIHKSETYTDWCRRPLSANQIHYALDDVRFLVPVYQKLLRVLKKLDRLEWVQDEFEALMDPKAYELPDPREQYLKIKSIRNLKPRNLAVLRELAAWREEEAMRRDCLPKGIVRDEPLLEIARLLPKNLESLTAIRGFHRREGTKSGSQILKAIDRGVKVPPDAIPRLPEQEVYSTTKGVEELLAAYVQIRAEELKIEPSILAHRKQIHSFVSWYEQNKKMEEHFLFQTWRREYIGIPLYSILDGKMGLAIDKAGKVRLVPADPSESVSGAFPS